MAEGNKCVLETGIRNKRRGLYQREHLPQKRASAVRTLTRQELSLLAWGSTGNANPPKATFTRTLHVLLRKGAQARDALNGHPRNGDVGDE